MKRRRLSLFVITALMIAACAAGFVVSSSAASNNASNIAVVGFNNLSDEDTVIVGKNGNYALEWQILDKSKTNTGSTSGMFLVSKYLMAANAYNGNEAGTYSAAQSSLNDIYSQYISEIERNALISTSKSDSSYTVINSDANTIDDEDYDGYTDKHEDYAVVSPSKNQEFSATSITDAHLFMLSAEEADKYIENGLGDEFVGLSSVVRRPNIYSFALPDNYESLSADNRDWWLRSNYSSDGYKGVMSRVIRKDTSLYNSFNIYGLIGHRETGETAWLRPAFNMDSTEVSFMYQVKLKTSTKSYFAAASTVDDSFYTTLKNGTYASGQISGNAWKPAYKNLNDIAVSNAKRNGTTLTFELSDAGGNSIGYFIYSGDNIVGYGSTELDINGKYSIENVEDGYQVKLFSFKLDDGDISTSSLLDVSYTNSTLAQKGNSTISNGTKVYLDGKKFKVVDASGGNVNTLINNDGNKVGKDKAIYLVGENKKEFSSDTKTYYNSKALQSSINNLTASLSENYYLKNSLLDADGNKFFALSQSEINSYDTGYSADDVWLRDQASYDGDKYTVPAVNLLRENILMVNQAWAFEVERTGDVYDVIDIDSEDEYELTLKLPQQYNEFKVTSTTYNKRYNKIYFNYEGIAKSDKDLSDGYHSYISAIITDKQGAVIKYGRIQGIYSQYYLDGTSSVSIDGYESGYKLYVFNEISKDPPSKNIASNYANTRYASTFREVEMKNISGNPSISGTAYSGETLTLDVSDANFSLNDAGTVITWCICRHYYVAEWSGTREVYEEVKEIKSGSELTCQLPAGYNDYDYYVKVKISNSGKEGELTAMKQMESNIDGDYVIQSSIQPGSRVYFGDYNKSATSTVFSNNKAIPWKIISENSGNATGSSDYLITTKSSDLTAGSDESGKDGKVDNDDAILMLSEYSLAESSYNKTSKSSSVGYNLWDGSDAQAWCSNFAALPNAASLAAANAVAEVEQGEFESTLFLNKSDASEEYFGRKWAENTVSLDRFFLLSAEEVAEYISDDEFEEGSAARTANNINSQATTWWTRSTRPKYSGQVSVSGGIVDENGEVNTNDVYYNNGMRPAVNLDSNKIVMTTLAVNGKKTTLAEKYTATPYKEDDPLYQLRDAEVVKSSSLSNAEWKLTLLDSAHSSFDVNVKSCGNMYRIEYSGAQTGTNEYLSVVRKNKDGEIIAYQKIKQLTDSSMSSGTIDFEIWDLEKKTGDVDYIINEQCNGDYQTDYCSKLHTLAYKYNYQIVVDGPEISTDPSSVPIEKEESAEKHPEAAGNTVTIKYDNVPDGSEITEAYGHYVGSSTKEFTCTVDSDKKTITFTQPSRNVVIVIKVSYPTGNKLTIVNTGYDQNTGLGMSEAESAVYEITGKDVELARPVYVSVAGGSSATVSGLTSGKTYYVRNVSDWSWRYDRSQLTWGGTPEGKITYDNDKFRWEVEISSEAEVLTVTNRFTSHRWLCDETILQNTFN